MKIYATAFLLFFAVLLSSQCKHPKYSALELPGKQLRFGNGGGFTGIETTYILLENGQLFKFASKAPTPVELAGVRRKTAAGLFETAEKLDLLPRDFMHPGNTYSFLELQDNGLQRRIAWGDREHPVAPEIIALFEQLSALAVEKK